MTTGIAGTGRVAQALGRRLQEAGHPIGAVAGRSREQAQTAARFIGGHCQPVLLGELHCERVLIAVADSAIAEVAASLSGAAILLHTCGAYGGELLARERARGIRCGSLHPLQTFASPEAAYRVLPGSAFAVDGDLDALAWAVEIATCLDGLILRIPTEARAIYHAAAAMASNHLISVLDAAGQLLRIAGVPSASVWPALGPIARASLDNVLEDGPEQALTGPVQRGDTGTVARHLEAIGVAPLSVRELYLAASLHALDIALRRGMDPARAQDLRSLLQRQ